MCEFIESAGVFNIVFTRATVTKLKEMKLNSSLNIN